MYFSQRLKVVEEYYLWKRQEEKKIGVAPIDNHETFLAFLETKGYLKEENAQSVGEGKPRDMIELPCKEHFVYKHDDGHITENWRVFYRAEFALIGTAVFPTEPEADAFLADLKGGER